MSTKKEEIMENVSRKIYFGMNRQLDFHSILNNVKKILQNSPVIKQDNLFEVERKIIGSRLKEKPKPPLHPNYHKNLKSQTITPVHSKKAYQTHMAS